MPSSLEELVAVEPMTSLPPSVAPSNPSSDPSADPAAPVSAVRLEGVIKRFGDVEAVAGIDLDIADGEFFSMLGPSGSGKTTTLRMIAGFEQPTEGRVLLHGRDVTGVPPFDRDVNTVFQDYALLPAHDGWRQRRLRAGRPQGAEARSVEERVREALRMVRLEGYEGRRAAQLSGGQRQRVALARALVNRPSVLLLDEPLGALDLKLREEMQIELKAIQSEVGITFIYVTHDQEEALTMSDRLAVFNGGRIEQIGTPADVYEHPATTFVAGFVGTSNLLTGEAARAVIGEDGIFTVRPEKIRLADPADAAGDRRASADGHGPRSRLPRPRHAIYRRASMWVASWSSPSRTSRHRRWRPSPPRARPVRLIWKRRARAEPGRAEPGNQRGTRRSGDSA